VFLLFFLFYFLLLNYFIFKNSKDIFNPFHLSSFALFYYTTGPLLFNEFISKEFYGNIIYYYQIIIFIAITGLFLGFKIKSPNFILFFKRNKNHKVPLLFSIIFFFIIVSPNLVSYFSVSSDYSNALESRTSKNSFSPIVEYLVIYFLFSSQFYVLLNIKNSYLKIILILALFLPSILSGSRVLFIGSLFIIASSLKTKINTIKIVNLFSAFIIGLIIFSVFGITRGRNLSFSEIIDLFDVIYNNDGVMGFIFSGEFINPGNSLFYVLVEYSKIDNFFLYGKTYLNDFISMIPNIIIKHPITSIDFYHIKFHLSDFKEGKGYGFSPITEAFWNFGFLGVFIIMGFLGFLLKFFYKILTSCNSNLIYYSYFSVFFYLNFTMFRGSLILVFKNFFLHIVLFLLIELVFNKLFIKYVK
jgi:oligosaccharide repeat unit polymerase